MGHKNGMISVIIPIYNVEPYLRQCLDSVVNQTYRNLEIILIDDGSPDNCGAICDEYAQKDDRIVVIHKQNGGVGAARNDGIERTTGEWVTFVDPDDWCDVDFYERLFSAMSDQKVDIICSGGYFGVYGNTKIEYCAFTKNTLLDGKEQTDLLMAKTLIGNCGDTESKHTPDIGPVWNKLYKRSFLLQNQLIFDTTLHPLDDVLFNFLAFNKAERVAVCSCIGYYYRKQVVTSATTRFNPRMPSMYVTLFNSLSHCMRHGEPNELIQDAIRTRTIMQFRNTLKGYFFHKSNPNSYKITASEIRELKQEPTFHAAIHSKSNRLLTKKQVVLKRLLRLPWVWPLKLAYSAKQILPKQR